MSRINFVFDFKDEMFDEAALQLIKSKVREAVSSEIDRQLDQHIDTIVTTRIRELVSTLDNRYRWGKEAKEKLDKAIIDQIANIQLEEAIKIKVNQVVNPVMSYANEQIERIDNYSKAQLRDIMCMLKQIFCLAIDKDYIIKNPMHSTLVYNPSKRPGKPRQAISQKDQADIIAHLDDLRSVYDRHGDNMNALRFMAFLMFTGLRPCEIYGLRWEDIDAERKTLTVNRDLVFVSGEGILGEPKTEESRRTIPFDPEILKYISPIQSTGFIIHMSEKGRESEHFTEQAATNMWNRIKKNIDVHGMTPYMARHTYATNMNKAGVPIKTAMSMMGHKDERMLLRRYTHTDNEDLTNAAR